MFSFDDVNMLNSINQARRHIFQHICYCHFSLEFFSAISFLKHQMVNVYFQIDTTALDIQAPLVDHIASV